MEDKKDSNGLDFQISEVQFVRAGCHFGADFEDDASLSKGVGAYNNRRICHLISRQPSVVGIINKQGMETLYLSFPSWKEKVQSINKMMFNIYHTDLKNHQEEIDRYNSK